ncbi:Protein of unknown function [Pyronema omphalodes CBS 100304]|uniref:Uncharacterized protein n=1 Tax=Pyronema omphalodes (strain CBS 100304) TaxID=1076935 RepID=U4LUP1_PYROM|nr:Protein of unknown function [Pyronema omphalodes CBS 100304]
MSCRTSRDHLGSSCLGIQNRITKSVKSVIRFFQAFPLCSIMISPVSHDRHQSEARNGRRPGIPINALKSVSIMNSKPRAFPFQATEASGNLQTHLRGPPRLTTVSNLHSCFLHECCCLTSSTAFICIFSASASPFGPATRCLL